MKQIDIGKSLDPTIECIGHSFADVAHFVIVRDVWIRTQRFTGASKSPSNLATHLPNDLPVLCYL